MKIGKGGLTKLFLAGSLSLGIFGCSASSQEDSLSGADSLAAANSCFSDQTNTKVLFFVGKKFKDLMAPLSKTALPGEYVKYDYTIATRIHDLHIKNMDKIGFSLTDSVDTRSSGNGCQLEIKAHTDPKHPITMAAGVDFCQGFNCSKHYHEIWSCHCRSHSDLKGSITFDLTANIILDSSNGSITFDKIDATIDDSLHSKRSTDGIAYEVLIDITGLGLIPGTLIQTVYNIKLKDRVKQMRSKLKDKENELKSFQGQTCVIVGEGLKCCKPDDQACRQQLGL